MPRGSGRLSLRLRLWRSSLLLGSFLGPSEILGELLGESRAPVLPVLWKSWFEGFCRAGPFAFRFDNLGARDVNFLFLFLIGRNLFFVARDDLQVGLAAQLLAKK